MCVVFHLHPYLTVCFFPLLFHFLILLQNQASMYTYGNQAGEHVLQCVHTESQCVPARCLDVLSNHMFLVYQVYLIKEGNVVAPYKYERVRVYIHITGLERIA